MCMFHDCCHCALIVVYVSYNGDRIRAAASSMYLSVSYFDYLILWQASKMENNGKVPDLKMIASLLACCTSVRL